MDLVEEINNYKLALQKEEILDSSIDDIIEKLEHFSMTKEMLIKTQIFKAIKAKAEPIKNSNPILFKRMLKLYKIWKEIYKEKDNNEEDNKKQMHKKDNKNQKDMNEVEVGETKSSKFIQKPIENPKKKIQDQIQKNPRANTNSKKDKQNAIPSSSSTIQYLDESEREKVVNYLFGFLIPPTNIEFKEDERKNLCKEIEEEIYNEFNKMGGDKNIKNTKYRDKIRSIKFNITTLLIPIFKKEISPSQLAKMDPRDMISKEEKSKRNEEEKKSFEMRISNWDQVKMKNSSYESIYSCGKCGSKKITYYQQQTRGADEPMTIFFHCVNCGTEWKK